VSVVVNWNQKKSYSPNLYFSDLQINQAFRIKGGRGAVYVKIKIRGGQNDGQEYMLELATGKAFQPTISPIELIRVEINISASKPLV